MYKITTEYKLPHLKDIDLHFFLESYRATNNYIDKLDFILKLPQVKKLDKKIKNEEDAINSKQFICLRPSIKISPYYRLASLFIKKEDSNKCKKIFRNDLIKPEYDSVSPNEKKRISNLYDELKKEGYDYKVIRNTITETVIDFFSSYEYSHKVLLSLIIQIYNDLKEKNYLEGQKTIFSLYNTFFEKKYPEKAQKIKEKERKKIEDPIAVHSR